MSWPELAAAVRGCTACAALVANRSCVVVGQAPPGARLAVVGEAPGAQEDEQGLPFVGRAGRVLDEALAAAGVERAEVAVLNVVKCRPPGNRKPLPAEIKACRPWLTRQLELVRPEIVLALGGTAIAWFLGPRVTVGGVRGRVHEAGGYRVMPTYHPSGALRFGPKGAPMAALRDDVAAAAALAVAACR
jgi:DNA polymerase